MNNRESKIALGGGCHWCTEAVFQALKGVSEVKQGYVASTGLNNDFSEAVIVCFDEEIIPLAVLIEIHLHTHKSSANHSFRTKYRSAVYYFSKEQGQKAQHTITGLQPQFPQQLITQVLPFSEFKASRDSLLNYYHTDPEKPFCKRYIHPKLTLLKEQFKSRTLV